VIVGPAGEAAHPVGVAGPSAEDDHRQVRVDARGEPVGGADAVEQGQAIPVLQGEIEHDQRCKKRDGRGSRPGRTFFALSDRTRPRILERL
jgi:hypothetical protein